MAIRPVEPPPCRWTLPDPRFAEPDQELLGLGADLAPGTMLAGYRTGIFPMHVDLPDETTELGWWSPNPRGVLRPPHVNVSRSLRRSMRRFEVTFDQAFNDVVAGCADPNRPHGWINSSFVAAYRELYELGWAHSVEVWLADESRTLVGGLFGIQLGGVFAAESKFHRETDASKVAVVALAEHIASLPNGGQRLIDTQWPTQHLETLGVQALPRNEYLVEIGGLRSLPPDW